MSIPLSHRGHLYNPGYPGTNMTRLDWVGDSIGIQDNLRYWLWNYENWNSIKDYTGSNKYTDQGMISLGHEELSRDFSSQIDVAWSYDSKFIAQAFTYTDDGPDVIYIWNGSNIQNDEPIKLYFDKGNVTSISWGVVEGTHILFIATLQGEIWSWYRNFNTVINDITSTLNLEYQTENNESLQYVDVSDINTATITGVHSDENGNGMILLNSTMNNINSRSENGPIDRGKWEYGDQIKYYYSIMDFSSVYSVTQNEGILNHENYYILDPQSTNSGKFRFSFSDTFNLFGVLVDDKIRVYNTTLGKPISENLIFEYFEAGIPIDEFAIHPSSPFLVFNRGLPNPNSNNYESEIVVVNIITKSFEYVLIPSIFITENKYIPIEVVYGINYFILAFTIVMTELTIRSKLRKREKYRLKMKIISERAESLYPKK